MNLLEVKLGESQIRESFGCWVPWEQGLCVFMQMVSSIPHEHLHRIGTREMFAVVKWQPFFEDFERQRQRKNAVSLTLRVSFSFPFRLSFLLWIQSVQFSRLVMSDSLWLHELQHARPPCLSATPRVHPNSCPLSRWCHPAISSSVVPFSSCPQSLPASESFPMSQLLAWSGQSIGVSALAPVLPKNTGKTIALTRQTFAGKVMSLFSNMLSRLVITFLPRNKRLLISWLQSPSAVILEPKKIKSDTVSTISPSISHEVMGPDAMIFVFWMLSFKSTFSLSSFTFIKKLFSSSSLSAIRVVSSAYLRLLIFLPAILIPACASSILVFHKMYSAQKLNKQGDNIQSWRIPFPIWNQSVVPCPVLHIGWPAYRFLKRPVRWSGIPISWRIFHSLLWPTQSLWHSQ